MKRIYKILLTFVLCFSFINTVSAKDPIYTSIYRNERAKIGDEKYVKFAIYQFQDDGMVFATPMNEFTVKEETQGPSDYWTDSDIKLINDEGKAKKLKPKDKLFENKKFFHYDMVKDGFGTGRNKLYLGDDDLIDYDFDLLLEKTDKYKASEPNAILQELMCTYGPGEGMRIGSGPQYVSFEVFRKDSGLFYQVYLDFEPVFNDYQILDEGYKGYDGIAEYDSISIHRTWYLNDHFSTSVFWNSIDGHYGCPSNIMLGYSGTTVSGSGTTVSQGTVEVGWKEIMDNKYSDTTTGIFKFEHDYDNNLILYKNSSYVEYEQGEKNTQTCIYSSQVCDPDEEDCVDNWEYALKESYYDNGFHAYELHENSTLLGKLSWQKKFKNIYYDIPSGLIDKECANLPIIYTNCINGDKSSHYYEKKLVGNSNYSNPNWIQQVPDTDCVVASQEFKGAQKLYSNKYLDNWTLEAVQESMGESDGYLYKKYICDLKTKLETYTTRDNLGKTSNLLFVDSFADEESGEKKEFNYNISFVPCTDWGTQSEFTCTTDECKADIRYNVNKQVRKILYYCDETYKNFLKQNSNETLLRDRHNECSSFKIFYQSLVDNGIIDDMLDGCDIVTPELGAKLNWVLNVFKIAGPIMAVILGMIDFTKVLVAGEADKEMKSAWKRFKTRLIAAALLFIIPMILSMLINIFIGDEINNNPYCNLFEETTK